MSRLGSLRSVGFKSPIYPPSGVSLLCNYAIHVVYHLGQLSELDSADVSSKAIKDTADVRKLDDTRMKKTEVGHALTRLSQKLL